jgi:dihydroneopterin aldolase
MPLAIGYKHSGAHMDKIILKGMYFYGYHGTTEKERKKGQKFYIDAEISSDLKKAGKSDNLSDTIDYKKVYRLVRTIQSKKKYGLLEALSEGIASGILKEFKNVVNSVAVRVRKPQVDIGGPLEYVEVEVVREKITVR